MSCRLALIALLFTGCVTPLAKLHQQRDLTIGSARFLLRWSSADDDEQRLIAAALEKPATQTARWGALEQPVSLYVLATHDDLERAVSRRGFDWLRAWARFDELFLQSPRSWPGHPSDADLRELLTHEITHCVMYQRSATPLTWQLKRIPLWFREGMATVTAGQGARLPSLEDLAAWLKLHRDLDAFADGEVLSRTYFDEVYGLAHHAFSFLLKRYGERAVIETMETMRRGQTFDEAFLHSVGLAPERFTRDFSSYVRLRGFRGGGLPVHRAVPVHGASP